MYKGSFYSEFSIKPVSLSSFLLSKFIQNNPM